MNQDDIYFEKLKTLLNNAYVPYSNFRVSCLLLTEVGLFAGVNVENAAYSPTICAERSAIATMITSGIKKILKIYLLTDAKNLENSTPCGVCRQTLIEFADPNTPIIVYKIDGTKKKYTVSELLPYGFSKSALEL